MHTKGYFKGFKFIIRRPKNKPACANCGKSGHNRSTCERQGVKLALELPPKSPTNDDTHNALVLDRLAGMSWKALKEKYNLSNGTIHRILKENNLLWIVDTKHKTHVCSVCGNSGHNKATCKQRKLMQTDNYMWASG